MNPGTAGGGSVTTVGDRCAFLANSHVGHDCHVGNNVIFSNNVMLAGHCTVGDFAIIGGGAAVIQFARVGAHAFLGGMSGLENDLIPYGMALGNRAYLSGLNIIGLQRRGFSRNDIHDLRRAYRLLFAAEGTLVERIEDVAEEFSGHADRAGNRRVHPRGRQALACARRRTARRAEAGHERAGRSHRASSRGAVRLPREVAHSVVNRGGSVHIVMLEGADPALETFPHTRVNWAQLGRATAALKRAGVREILVLGAGARPSFRNARPDFAFIRSLPAVLRLLKAGGDDAVLRGLLGVLEAQGLTVVGVGDVAREQLIAEGALTEHSPSPEDAADIEKGFALIAALGRYDIGQAAIVTDGRIEAIEGAEGTDRMLKRVAEARRIADRRGRRGVLVKRPKPGQDLRVDLPAIGPNTVRNADAAGLAGIAVMAGHVLAAKRSEMIAYCR